MKNITKEQLLTALDLIKDITDEWVTYSIKGQLENQIVIEFYDGYEDYHEETIIIGPGNIIENPKIAELKKDIFNAEQTLLNLKKELAKLTQE